MNSRLISFLSMQLMTVPLILACAVGVAIGLSRGDLGTRARLGAAGFGLLLLAQLLTVLQNYLMVYRFEPGDYMQMAKLSVLFAAGRLVLTIAGFVVLIFAVFHRDRPAAA